MSEVQRVITPEEPEDRPKTTLGEELEAVAPKVELGPEREVGLAITKIFDMVQQLEQHGKIYNQSKFIVQPSEFATDRVEVELPNIPDSQKYVSLHAGSLDPGITEGMDHEEEWQRIKQNEGGLASGSINDAKNEPIFTFAVHSDTETQYYPGKTSPERFTGQVIYNPTGEEVLPGSELFKQFTDLAEAIGQKLNQKTPYEMRQEEIRVAKEEAATKAAKAGRIKRWLGGGKNK